MGNNIAFAKLGKLIKFNSNKWTPIGGDNEAPFLLYTLAKAYPQDTFWIIGRSDYSKVFPEGLLPNIKDLWSPEYWPEGVNPNRWIPRPQAENYKKNPETFERYYTYVSDTLSRLGVTINFAYILYGMGFTNSLFGATLKVNGDGFASTLAVPTEKSSFIIDWLNKYSGEYVSIITDPRHYDKFPRDLLHWESVILSQINNDKQEFKGYTEQSFRGRVIKEPQKYHKSVYSGVETLNLLSKEPYDTFPEKSGFNLILNEGYPGTDTKEPPRYTELKKWILNDPDFECNIYGKWEEKILESDKRFKGPILPIQLGSILKSTKYTLCIPIAPGWITAKFLEMAHFGVIPFVTDTYGTQSGAPYIPDELRVKSLSELKEKIKKLDEDEKEYKKLREYLANVLGTMYDGSYVLGLMRSIISTNCNYFIKAPLSLRNPVAWFYKQDIEKQKQQYENMDELF